MVEVGRCDRPAAKQAAAGIITPDGSPNPSGVTLMATNDRNVSAVARQTLCVALAAAQKACAESYDRDELLAGAHHQVKISLAAEVDGVPVLRDWDCTLDVGHDSVRASSVGVKPGELLAYILSRQNAVTREATLRDLADVYAANGRLPVDEAEVKAADDSLSRLRQKVEQAVKGSVRVAVRDPQPAVAAQPETAETVEAKPLAAAARKTKPAASKASKSKKAS